MTIMVEWLKYILLKLVTLGKRDIRQEKKREESLLEILRLVQQAPMGGWMFEQDKRVVKKTVPRMIYVGDDDIMDFFFPRTNQYEVDSSK